jgi:hypothetical protein
MKNGLQAANQTFFYKKILSRGEAVFHRSRYKMHSEEKGNCSL